MLPIEGPNWHAKMATTLQAVYLNCGRHVRCRAHARHRVRRSLPGPRLSPRCGSGVSQGVGLTLQACVRADLQHVHGAIYLHVNATGAATHQGSTGTLSVRIDIWKNGQIANAASWNSSPYAILNMPNVYILYSFDAPYVHGLGYQTVGNDRGRISSPARAARSFTHRPFTHRRKFGRDLFSF